MERKADQTKRIIDAMAPTFLPEQHALHEGDPVRAGNAEGVVVRVISPTEVQVQWQHLRFPRRELGERLTKLGKETR